MNNSKTPTSVVNVENNSLGYVNTLNGYGAFKANTTTKLQFNETPQSITPTQNHNLGYGEKQNPEFEYKCVKCETQITQLDSCGTGTSWSLYICSNCGHNHAVGYVPEAAKDDNTTVFNRGHIGYGALQLNAARRSSLGHTSEISNHSEASVKLAETELGKNIFPDEPLEADEGFAYKCAKCANPMSGLNYRGGDGNYQLYECLPCGHAHVVGTPPEGLIDIVEASVFSQMAPGHSAVIDSSVQKAKNVTMTAVGPGANTGGVQVTSPASQEYSGPDLATIVSHLKTAVGFDWKDTFVDNMPKVHSGPSGISIIRPSNETISSTTHEAARNALNGVSIKLTRKPKLSVDSLALQGVLADYEIKDLINSGLMGITPFTDQKVSSSGGIKRISYGLSSMGYDATLHEDVYFISKDLSAKPIDPKNTSLDQYSKAKVHTDETGSYVLVPPHTFVLGRTIEHFKIPNFIIATVTSKSTYARCGIPTIATPIEPGFYGTITLEFINSTEHYNKLYINEGVVQLLFHVSNKPDKDYTESGGKYNGQTDVRAAEV